MNNDPFQIRIFAVDGNPDGIRRVDKLNWTGVGIVFPRDRWPAARDRPELGRTGIYVLVGYKEGDDELPTLYIGEGDAVKTRIDQHAKQLDFWQHGYVFTTSNDGLNKAHARWLERELIRQAKKVKQSKLENVQDSPNELALTEGERADSQAFLREILQVLPIMGLRAFREAPPVAAPRAHLVAEAAPSPASAQAGLGAPDDVVVVVPAQDEGFKAVFLGESRWRSIRISGGKLHQIRYIAAYRKSPISAVTHLAPVATIEPYGEDGKYQLIFSDPAIEIEPIRFGDAPIGYMQSPRYTTLGKLRAAKKLMDMFGPTPAPL